MTAPNGVRATWTGIGATAAAVRDGRVTADALAAAALARIAAVDAEVRAYAQVFAESGTVPARGRLAGVPVSVKDNIDVRGRATGLGRPPGERAVAATDAPVVAALRRAGATVVGKTTLPEFACSAITHNTVTGHTRNPADPRRSAGGSSGGSAASVAAGTVMGSLGTDTAGSVLVPAALNGVCGLRPTHGRVDTAGVFPSAPSLDTVGVFAPTPADLAALAAVLLPGTGAPPPPGPRRIGVLADWAATADAGIRSAFTAALDGLVAHGHRLVPVRLPEPESVTGHARVVYLDEVARSLHDLPPVGTPYSAEVELRRVAAERLTRAEIVDAHAARTAWRRLLRGRFDRVDVLVCPAAPDVAPLVADAATSDGLGLVRYAYPFCFAGVPAVTVPLPVPGAPAGLLLVGPWDGEPELLALAAQLAPS